MTKTITSPVDKFPGTVVMPEYLTLPQVLAFEAASDNIGELRKAATEKGDDGISRTKIDQQYLPVILSIVTEWRIDGVPNIPSLENFPLTPRRATAELIAWLIGEITRLWVGEIEIPNG